MGALRSNAIPESHERDSEPIVRAFAREALPRLRRILDRLSASQAGSCGRCAEQIAGDLRAFAAEAYFFGLLRTHRLARRACAGLAQGECQACIGNGPSSVRPTCVAVEELREELLQELVEVAGRGAT